SASDLCRRADNALFNRLAHKNADRFGRNHGLTAFRKAMRVRLATQSATATVARCLDVFLYKTQ
ncbi:hypothetical protein, partial [Burkholderia ubonensis]|uniref:hypothetical protein n=1 Tax=Burkholderia ubonensis TaxID=101571 RepID=UPI001E437A63